MGIKGVALAGLALAALNCQPVRRVVKDDVERLALRAHPDRARPHGAIGRVETLAGFAALAEPRSILLFASEEILFLTLKLEAASSIFLRTDAKAAKVFEIVVELPRRGCFGLDRLFSVDERAVLVVWGLHTIHFH